MLGISRKLGMTSRKVEKMKALAGWLKGLAGWLAGRQVMSKVSLYAAAALG